MERPEPDLTEISAGIGLSKSTTHRLLSTLEEAGMVELDRKTGRYRLGLKTFRLGSVASGSLELVRQAEPLLRDIAEETGQTSLLLVADVSEALCVRRFDGDQQVRVLVMEAGKRGALQLRRLAARASCPPARIPLGRGGCLSRRAHDLVLPHDTGGARLRPAGDPGAWVLASDGRTALFTRPRWAHRCGRAGGEVVASVSILGIVQQFPAERLPVLIRRVMQLGRDLRPSWGMSGRDCRRR